MHRRYQLSAHLAALTDAQAGVVTTNQLLASGVPPGAMRRVRAGWMPLAPGIYSLASPTWMSVAWAGIVRSGGSGILGDRAAAFLGGLIRDEPKSISVWVAPGLRFQPIRFADMTVTFRQAERTAIGNPPRTPIVATLIDLAGVCGEEELLASVTRALAKRLILPAHLIQAMDARIRLRHRRLLMELCSEMSIGLESVLEWRFDEAVLRRHRLPPATRQVKLSAGRADLVFTGYNVIVELDGQRDHLDWSRDMLRDNEHLIEYGAPTFRYGWTSTIFNACEVAEQLGRALRARGWNGIVRHPRACARNRRPHY